LLTKVLELVAEAAAPLRQLEDLLAEQPSEVTQAQRVEVCLAAG
jgi:hypothetical protein